MIQGNRRGNALDARSIARPITTPRYDPWVTWSLLLGIVSSDRLMIYDSMYTKYTSVATCELDYVDNIPTCLFGYCEVF